MKLHWQRLGSLVALLIASCGAPKALQSQSSHIEGHHVSKAHDSATQDPKVSLRLGLLTRKNGEAATLRAVLTNLERGASIWTRVNLVGRFELLDEAGRRLDGNCVVTEEMGNCIDRFEEIGSVEESARSGYVWLGPGESIGTNYSMLLCQSLKKGVVAAVRFHHFDGERTAPPQKVTGVHVLEHEVRSNWLRVDVTWGQE